MVIGSAPKGKAVLRSGARPGDVIYVTGQLGGSTASLRQLFAGGISALSPDRDHSRHFFPQPRIEVARLLREQNLAHAMIDLSDGLSTDLAHICEESGVGATLNQLLLPIAGGATLDDALHGGEDYELLFTAPPSRTMPVQIAGVAITEIGWITRERGMRITDVKNKSKRLPRKGWEHFHGGRQR
jgi:thiamine-monophosphate kinase